MMDTDPVGLRIVGNLLESVAEEMGTALERSGVSPNIKERRDHSCAIFDGNAQLVAQAAHIPVHLGAMPIAVKEAARLCPLAEGDIVLLNDPRLGGTHLPDITTVQAFRLDPSDEQPSAYLATRAHHADVGGTIPGSMGITRSLKEEGVVISPTTWVRGGQRQLDVEDRLLSQMRNRPERIGDLLAQRAALDVGKQGLLRIINRIGLDPLKDGFRRLQDAAERHTRTLLKRIPDGTYRATDQLDNDGIDDSPLTISVEIRIDGGQAIFDFTGTAGACEGPLNCNKAVVLSAIQYVIRSLAGEEMPTSSGTLRSVQVIIPSGSLLDPPEGSPVAGGNVETSQRLVDVLLLALTPALPDVIPAQSQGTMNNLVIGDDAGAYYETIGGGCGGGPDRIGASGRHAHMTNTLNTPIERLEHSLPVLITQLGLRKGSGGDGLHRGGEGVIREYQLLESMQVSILSDRRVHAPSGIAGGKDGLQGNNILIKDHGSHSLPGKWQGVVEKGHSIRVETPGGGGWGVAPD
ncbi:MAG: hydantoinase B/oxoprolinase family protein [Planctomycetota bacterium]|nr:hydantoinase B/oxoprolinase family protein [Planctomycetota bacterium]